MSAIPFKRNYVFKNWAGIYSAKPERYFQPTSIDEVVELVKNARLAEKTLVTVGSGHSPSNMCVTDEWLVNLDKLNTVQKFVEYPDLHYADVTVDAGMRLYQLNEFLGAKGYSIQNLGSISEQSVAGIISTGSHGSSPYHGLISSQFVNLTIVNGKGEVKFLDSENDSEVFKAALLSVGKIGIIVSATVRVIPGFNIKSTQEVITFEDLLKQWDTLWTSSEFIRVWWYPYTRKCVLWRGNKTESAQNGPAKSWWGTKLGRFFYETLLWISTKVYAPLTPFVEKFVFNRQYGKLEKSSTGDVNVTDSISGFNMDCLFSQFVDEWGCPMDNGLEVLRSLDHSIAQAAISKEFYVHVPMEVRCSNTTLPSEPLNTSKRTNTSPGAVYGNVCRPFLDNTPSHCRYAPLDNVTNSQLTLYINATIYRPFGCNTPIHKWFTLFENTMMVAGGKPHWAKNFLGSTTLAAGPVKKDADYDDFEMRGMAMKVEEWYGEDLKKFRKIRKDQDPDNVFLANKEWAIINGIIDPSELSN
ncbi:D-arabinono-1,4-lactone oxidase [Saccharomyces eubayanus]|uniref:D-arabinono-1,4-lactone oxidase n=1 Tax=Saccharomyces eubayanus TaxID=1080349 RepID=UPI0006C59C80|nr:ALO1-like protein [Saccharomyces eubayanus]KOG97267.1 ALO1-like protein [Saccharomyces eubayanus]